MSFKNLMLIIFYHITIFALQSQGKAITDEQLDSYKYGADEFSLAIIGDSGTEKTAKEVMELSTFDALLHLGDYDYGCDPNKYFTDILDQNRNYKFMGIVGNHDAKGECEEAIANTFLNNIYNKMIDDKNIDVTCEFSSSKFMWSCVYKNMRIIGLTPGISGADSRKEQLEFLKEKLGNATEDWKVCSWHFYDKYYHTGKYQEYGNIISGDNDGESYYDYCKDHGAIIFSAHDHVYARTRVMSKFAEPVIDEHDEKTDESIVQIRNGATVDILNGTGGWEIYIEQGEQKEYKWWQKKYAKGENNENAKKYGGLFCKFNYGGNNKKAYCEFKRINSEETVFDKFYIYRNDDPSSITYTQIDENFKNEKIKAYKIENNIKDNDGISDNVDVNNEHQNKKGFFSKLFSKSVIIIFGSICSAFIVLLGGIIIYKEVKRTLMDEEDNHENKKKKIKNEDAAWMEESNSYFS
ncbi:hypothetical protein BCR32DRAFT_266283 [Anaeromyces robustus]|uniref:Calcineurin-like phosphoesterase domain-containing protein n=1 Tax=Anaeromyces robustus TaxID=1754192 RepID=A0A1Y1XFG8_9FUNG|nr:hypothetical protein BCR32DRAFT_266283 [Anaeromyces robustus]|eukprot:ORX84495.1 hypothetical protein BCR32DRAFT_266283 [Anaeromyces robustus]